MREPIPLWDNTFNQSNDSKMWFMQKGKSKIILNISTGVVRKY